MDALMIDHQLTTNQCMSAPIAIAGMLPSDLLQALHKQPVSRWPRLVIEARKGQAHDATCLAHRQSPSYQKLRSVAALGSACYFFASNSLVASSSKRLSAR